jgi:hypothetical protein
MLFQAFATFYLIPFLRPSRLLLSGLCAAADGRWTSCCYTAAAAAAAVAAAADYA